MAKLNTKKHKKYDMAMLRKIRKMVFYAEKDIKKGKISEATLLLDEIMKMKHLSDNMSVEEMYTNYNEASKMIEQLKQMATLVEDLWYLEKVITPGAMVSGKSLRLFRPRPDAPAERKPVYITIEAEKVEFSKYGVSLRVTGRIASGRHVR